MPRSADPPIPPIAAIPIAVATALAMLLATAARSEIPAGEETPDPAAMAETADRVGAALGSDAFALVPIDVGPTAPATLVFELPIPDAPTAGATARLHRRSLRSPDFRLLARDASGRLSEIAPPAPRTWAGSFEDDPDSRIVASLDEEGGLHARVRVGNETWWLQPARDFDPTAAPEVHVAIHDADLPRDGSACGTPDPPLPSSAPAAPPATTAHSEDGETRRLAEIAFDCDYEYFLLNGSDVRTVLRDVERVMSLVEGIFEADTGITYEITTIIVRTADPDPYTQIDPSALLEEMRVAWNRDLGLVRRDVAHLMTGKPLTPPIVGIAEVGKICQRDRAYGLSMSRFTPTLGLRVALTAHELGHNWNAVHCDGVDCRLMCATLGGCSGDVSRFGAASRAAIASFRDGRGCLDDLAPPVAAPFVDRFETGTIDPIRWPWIAGAETATGGPPKPSEPRALVLDASGSEVFRDDEIRSNEIPLGGAPAAYLQWFTASRGVEPGEQLRAEIYSSFLIWEALDIVVSDGIDSPGFRYRGVRLPPIGLHDGFRLRLRTQVDEGNDDWFVDDVKITRSPFGVQLLPETTSAPPGGSVFFTVVFRNETSERQPFEAWLDAFRADGRAFAGNPVLGPRAGALAPGREIRKRVRLRIPDTARPSGPHVVRFGAGTFPDPDAVATFEITVTP